MGDSSILKLETRDFGCGPHLHLGMPQGSQTGHLYIKKFCPSLPATFLPKQARANFFWRDRPNFIQFDNPTLIPIVSGGHTPKMGVLASKLTNPPHWTSVRMEVDYPLFDKGNFLEKCYVYYGHFSNNYNAQNWLSIWTFSLFFNYYDSMGFLPFLIIIGENGKFPRSRLLGTYTILGFCWFSLGHVY